MKNREIKFRAWNLRKEIMTPQNEWIKNFSSDRWICIISGKDRNWIPMQYTGIKDANGIEIYESDIVIGCWQTIDELVRDYNDTAIPNWELGKIEYDPPEFVVSSGATLISLNEFCIPKFSDKLFVIGNIYQNFRLIHNLAKKEYKVRKECWRSEKVKLSIEREKLSEEEKRINSEKLEYCFRMSHYKVFGEKVRRAFLEK